MEPNRAAAREITLDLHVVSRDGPLAGQADPAGPMAVPGHVTVLLRELAGEDLLADAGEQLIGLVHSVGPLFGSHASLDHLIRPLQERRRDRQAEGLGGLEVDD